MTTTNLIKETIPEILAPAGGKAQFYAALRSGADAVYLGLKEFNARSRAENFSKDDLLELVPLAHKFNMKVLVTVNILIKDIEIDRLLETLSFLEEAEVDAAIVQDLGVAKIIRENFPNLRMHASTQLAVHNLEGVLEASEMGFKRVVVAREITATELRLMKDKVAELDVEIEAFCHGSLCYSYSGLCFFSGAEDARSGNRGECAYTCRVPYKVVSEAGHGFLFSMRDLDTSKSLDKLVKAGVDTLKIEGRKKDAQYVSSVVRLYRKQLDRVFGFETLRTEARELVADNRSLEEIEKSLRYSFHREPTSFFLNGRYKEDVIDLNNPTHKGIEIGKVINNRGDFIEFKSSTDIEKYDGIKLVPTETVYHSLPQHGTVKSSDSSHMKKKYKNETLEFSVRNMKVAGKTVNSVSSGRSVQIEIPRSFPKNLEGATVFKTRSDALKRSVEKISQAPDDYRLRAYRSLNITISAEIQGESIRVDVTASKFGQAIAYVSKAFQGVELRNKGKLSDDFESLFTVFGESGFFAKNLDVNLKTPNVDEMFVPRKFIKDIKKDLSQILNESYDDFIDLRLEKAKRKYLFPEDSISKTQSSTSFSLKFDRLDTIEPAIIACRSNSLKVKEIIFEPKRAFLPKLTPDELAQKLKSYEVNFRLKVRVALPTIIRAWDEALVSRWIKACANAGIRDFEVGNVGAFKYLEKWGVEPESLSSDFTLYAMNREAVSHLNERGVGTVALSIEEDFTALSAMTDSLSDEEKDSLQYIVFKDTPLFIAEACSLTALHDGCPTADVCGYRSLEIENPEGERFHVAHESCKSIVYGKDAFSVSGNLNKLREIGISNFKIDFLTRPYSEGRIKEVIKSIANDTKVSHTHPANFHRTLL